MISIDLKYCRCEVWPEQKLVSTVFPCGAIVSGTREENQQNIIEAESQGYKGENIVWRSLVDHELLHSLVAEILFDQPSKVLETEAGIRFHPSWERYEEEAIVLASQRHMNVNDYPRILYQFLDSKQSLNNLRDRFRFLKIEMWSKANPPLSWG